MTSRDIVLTEEQTELLEWMGARRLQLPAGQRVFLAAVSPDGGDFIDGNGARMAIQYSDLEELRDKGLVRYSERGQMGASSRPVAERVAVTAEGLEYLARAHDVPEVVLSVSITPEQTELLSTLVEETRRASGGQQYEFRAARGLNGDYIDTSGGRIPAFFPDINELASKGLISLIEHQSSVSFVVTPEGFSFYEEIKRSRGEAIARLETEVRQLFDRHVVDNFGDAVQRWQEAEDLLWRTDAEEQLTAIGHKCREALQMFAQVLYGRHCPDADPLPNDRTVDKVRSVLSARRAVIGETTEQFLIAYWGTVSDLAQRAEHDSQREARPLLWDDGRRLVFQTLQVMVELAAAVRE